MPGPFYGGDTDTCLAGIPAAPRNVLCDDDGMEFVWRQPRDLDEVRAVLDAAYQDPFDGYNWDGDEHWTPDLVLEWWEDRAQIDEWLARATFSDLGSDAEVALHAASEFRRYIAGGLRDGLLRYAEWLGDRRRG